MAIGLQNYPNIEPADSDYPDGRIKDNPGDGTGTPVNQETNGDIQEFFAKLMRIAGITPNGLPDNEYSGHQYIEALEDFVNTPLEWRYVGDPGEPPFENGWADGSSGINEPVRFSKDRFGIVRIEGGMSSGTPVANAFVLPVGFRPDRIIVPAAQIAGPGIAQVIVNPTGGVQIFSYIATGNNSGVDLSITFKAI